MKILLFDVKLSETETKFMSSSGMFDNLINNWTLMIEI